MRRPSILAALALAACAPQTPPTLDVDDNENAALAVPVSPYQAINRAFDRPAPKPRPEVR